MWNYVSILLRSHGHNTSIRNDNENNDAHTFPMMRFLE